VVLAETSFFCDLRWLQTASNGRICKRYIHSVVHLRVLRAEEDAATSRQACLAEKATISLGNTPAMGNKLVASYVL
jgi:hypothetical protein